MEMYTHNPTMQEAEAGELRQSEARLGHITRPCQNRKGQGTAVGKVLAVKVLGLEL